MTKTELNLENRIISLVTINYGLRGQDLILKLMGENLEANQNDLMDTVFDMIDRGDLVEIELVFPNHVSRSYLVPRGTNINVVRRRK